jgi:thiol-disulfide isomerase/thioredoxin
MQLLNHYSALILLGLLVGVGLLLVWRRGCKKGELLLLTGATAILASSWAVFRPVENPMATLLGKACLLEVQSPYCLGCLALKPTVDRLERDFSQKLVVRRVDIQGGEGQKLAQQYEIEFTPTFIFFDAAGREQWRSVGQIDAATVHQSLESTP